MELQAQAKNTITRSRVRRLLALSLAAGVISMYATARPAVAQCRPGDVLIGEDAAYWYCSSPVTPSDVADALQYSVGKMNPGLLGAAFRLRKEIIDVAGCLARNGTVYAFGAKLPTSSGCTQNARVDCSGLYDHAAEAAAAFVATYYCSAAQSSALRMLGTSAQGQRDQFARFGAYESVASGYVPLPGDAMFFAGTDGDRAGITHVAIYLGTGRDGRTLMINASSKAGKVIITTLSGELSAKLVGYGDIARLYGAL